MKRYMHLGALVLLFSSHAHACLTQEAENNNTESTANGPLCSGVTVQASISSRNDVDWYYFDTSSSGDITVSLSHGSNADFDWFLYRDSGSYILSGQSASNPETGTYKAAAAGRHYIKVTRYAGTGNYQLQVQFNGDGGGSPAPACNYGPRPSKPGSLTAYRVGSLTDTCVSLSEPAALLMGGGTDVDDAFSLRVAPHIQGGNIVVLRTTGTGAYNTYLQGLTNAASVETLIVDNRTKANSDYVDWVIRTAEFVWIAGGDQSGYISNWQGTKVDAAIQYVYNKGGVVGGTSAGNHVLSQTVYNPDGVQGAVSAEVVTDFCHNTIKFSNNFLQIPMLANTLNDTHFAQRDRMGRSAVFQAHLGSSGRVIGVSERTSLFVQANGQTTVDGQHEVYVLRADSQTQYQQRQCGQPVILHDLLRYRLQPGDSYNLLNNSSSVTPTRLGINGNFSSFYTPTNPY
ncbi:cyanophycinase [Alishewanella aestuarii B11]|uniref:Cyanophycinase n=1 Tax=Alishewanella aestuarii B11 TaxID=1197174 RepID=J1Q040_9ALTE|nr:pre-peptidase C-terminal domain-containing protein [Alishewanella aestuarii]EJI84358.1 cyanophycinase [Alishewanella aestuarii B11]